MANNDHVTKADLNAGLDSLRHELKGDMAVLRDELVEVIHDTETKLLKAFYGFAESTQQRLAQHDGYNERLAIIERRLTDLEKRINFPNGS